LEREAADVHASDDAAATGPAAVVGLRFNQGCQIESSYLVIESYVFASIDSNVTHIEFNNLFDSHSNFKLPLDPRYKAACNHDVPCSVTRVPGCYWLDRL
jgi:hypothetical protein